MDQFVYNTYVQILKDELLPAMGCTEPIAPYDQNPEPIRPVEDIPAEALAAILKRYEAERP